MTKAEQAGQAYLDLLSKGYSKREAVLFVAARCGVKSSAIYNRLRRAKVLPPYKHRRQCVHPQKVGFMAGEEIIARRVERDPCPRCGVRGDIPCGHNRTSRLSNVVFAG